MRGDRESTQGRGAARGISRRALLQGAAGAAAAGALGAAEPGVARKRRRGRRPNIVLILADDLGYGALGCYGQQTLLTPHLDRLAADGIRFTNGYAGGPLCAPSRCCLLTGLHLGHARVRANPPVVGADGITVFEPEDACIAQPLRAAGYRTGIFGKWGFGHDDAYVPLGEEPHPDGGTCAAPKPNAGGPVGDLQANVGDPSHPLQKGFDEFLGFVRHDHAAGGYYANYLWDGNQRVLLPEDAGEARGTYTPELCLDRALGFMERHRDEPFFLMLAPTLVHWPNHVPSTEPYAGMPWPEEFKRHAAMHTLLDAHVGRVRDQVERLGLADDTLVVFTSDNGPAEERAVTGSGACTKQYEPSPESALADFTWKTNGGLRGNKQSIYDGGIRVPLIAWGPGVVKRRGAVDGRAWAGYDLMPTFADLAGVTAPADIDGVSVRRWLTGERGRAVAHGPLYWERPPSTVSLSPDGSRPSQTTYSEATRSGRWKAVRYAPTTGATAPPEQWSFELYDLKADRSEQHDVAAQNRDVRARLERFMGRAHREGPLPRAAYRPRRTGRAWRRSRRHTT